MCAFVACSTEINKRRNANVLSCVDLCFCYLRDVTWFCVRACAYVSACVSNVCACNSWGGYSGTGYYVKTEDSETLYGHHLSSCKQYAAMLIHMNIYRCVFEIFERCMYVWRVCLWKQITVLKNKLFYCAFQIISNTMKHSKNMNIIWTQYNMIYINF